MIDKQVSPWYYKLWCYLRHGNAPAAYDPKTKIFRCMKCDNRWKS